jgi:hypothetical protein
VPQAPAHAGWYGWQVMATDGAAIALLLGGAAVADGGHSKIADSLYVLSLGAYAVGGPVIHGFHGEGGRGVLSLGMRLALPALAGVVGNSIAGGCTIEASDSFDSSGSFDSSRSSRGCDGLQGAGWGALVGIASAMALDAALLSHDSQAHDSQAHDSQAHDSQAHDSQAEQKPAARIGWAPAAGVSREQVWLGVRGAL